MSNDEWTKAWPIINAEPDPKDYQQSWSKVFIPNDGLFASDGITLREITAYEPAADIITKNDLAGGPKWISKAEALERWPVPEIVFRERNNKVPTHDPYTNPGALIYYECKCGAVLDPGTKSFAALNNAAMDAGWKIRFGEHHYQAHCVECGKGVE